MRVLIAGATGAIGRPLVRCLNQDHLSVFALARSPESTRAATELGAEPVVADALDAASVKAVIVRVRPDAVINELTSLPRHYTPSEMRLPPNETTRFGPRETQISSLPSAMRGCAVTCCKARHTGASRAPASPTTARRSPSMLRPLSLRAHAGMPVWNLRQRGHRTSSLSAYATAFSTVRVPGTARRRHGRASPPTAGSDYRRWPRRVELGAHRRCGRGDGSCARMRSRRVQHR